MKKVILVILVPGDPKVMLVKEDVMVLRVLKVKKVMLVNVALPVIPVSKVMSVNVGLPVILVSWVHKVQVVRLVLKVPAVPKVQWDQSARLVLVVLPGQSVRLDPWAQLGIPV